MREVSYTITDPDGIHARPAGLFAQQMQGFAASISLVRGDQCADGKRLFAIMKLRVKQGETILIRTEGADEDPCIDAALVWLTKNL